MEKHKEATLPNSCWNRAGEDELVFVLLARDIAAPDTIREWCRLRTDRFSKDNWEDHKIKEALMTAYEMEAYPKDPSIRPVVNAMSEEKKCYMCRKPLVEDEKDARIYELEGRLHRIDAGLHQYIDGLVTVDEIAGIVRFQRNDIPGENHKPLPKRLDIPPI